MNRPLCSFVAGATGFIGGHLVRQLSALGHQVRCDETDRQAMAGCDVVYVVTGNKETLRAAAESGCRRIVCSGRITSNFPAVFVRPTDVVGPGDAEMTPAGRLITRFLNGRPLIYIDRPINLIAVEDVAAGYILAAEKGVPGTCYVLGHRDLMLREMYQMLSELTGLPIPAMRLPGWFWRRKDSQTNELGMPRSSVKNALARAVCWFSQHGYVPRHEFHVAEDLLEAMGGEFDDESDLGSGALPPTGSTRV